APTLGLSFRLAPEHADRVKAEAERRHAELIAGLLADARESDAYRDAAQAKAKLDRAGRQAAALHEERAAVTGRLREGDGDFGRDVAEKDRLGRLLEEFGKLLPALAAAAAHHRDCALARARRKAEELSVRVLMAAEQAAQSLTFPVTGAAL